MTDLVKFAGTGLTAGNTIGVGGGAAGDTPVGYTPGTLRLTTVADSEFGTVFQVAPTGAGDNGGVGWDVGSNKRTIGTRLYFRCLDAWPGGAFHMLSGFDNAGNQHDWRVAISGSGQPGQIRFYPKSGNTNSPQGTLVLGDWYRVENYVKMDLNGDGAGTDGSYRQLLYQKHQGTPLYDSGWVGTATGLGIESIRLGSPATTPAGAYRLQYANLLVTDDADTLIGATGEPEPPSSGHMMKYRIGGVWKDVQVLGMVGAGGAFLEFDDGVVARL